MLFLFSNKRDLSESASVFGRRGGGAGGQTAPRAPSLTSAGR